jgi:hypothetical protein
MLIIPGEGLYIQLMKRDRTTIQIKQKLLNYKSQGEIKKLKCFVQHIVNEKTPTRG